MKTFRNLSIVALLGLASVPASAQVILDEGSFQITIDGAEAGVETFSIRRDGLGSDARIIAEIQVRHEDGPVEMRPILRADARLAPTQYDNQISGSRTSSVSLLRTGRRFAARVITDAGESEQEFRAGDGSLILEPRVATLYYFLSSMLGSVGREVYAVEPESGARPTFVLASVTGERFRIGREEVTARIAQLESGDDIRRIWFDDQGRVLRVEVPAHSFVAVRVPER